MYASEFYKKLPEGHVQHWIHSFLQLLTINLENKFEFDVLTNADVNSTFIIICFQPSKSPLREARQLNIERDWNFYWRYAAHSLSWTHTFFCSQKVHAGAEKMMWSEYITVHTWEENFLKGVTENQNVVRKLLANYEKLPIEFLKARVII